MEKKILNLIKHLKESTVLHLQQKPSLTRLALNINSTFFRNKTSITKILLRKNQNKVMYVRVTNRDTPIIYSGMVHGLNPIGQGLGNLDPVPLQIYKCPLTHENQVSEGAFSSVAQSKLLTHVMSLVSFYTPLKQKIFF